MIDAVVLIAREKKKKSITRQDRAVVLYLEINEQSSMKLLHNWYFVSKRGYNATYNEQTDLFFSLTTRWVV